MSQKLVIKSVAITLTGNPDKISSTSIKVPSFEFHNVTGNSNVYVGDRDVASTVNVPIGAATTKTFSASTGGDFVKGDYFDLSEVYVLGTAADVVRIQYFDTFNPND